MWSHGGAGPLWPTAMGVQSPRMSACIKQVLRALSCVMLFPVLHTFNEPQRHPPPVIPSVRNANQLAAICWKAGVELLCATGVITQRCAAFPMQNPAVCASSLTRLIRRHRLWLRRSCLFWTPAAFLLFAWGLTCCVHTTPQIWNF